MTHYTSMPNPSVFATSIEEGAVFLQCSLADPASSVLLDHVDLLRDCVALSQRSWGYEIEAAVVLPDQLQLLATFAPNYVGAASVGEFIQATFDFHLDEDWCGWSGPAELTPIDAAAVRIRKRFIEAAPVRRGLVSDPRDWPFSSVHQPGSPSRAIGQAVA